MAIVGDGGAWGLLMVLAALVFLSLLIAGVVLVARSFSESGRGQDGPSGNRALQILDERFARGEIDQADYEERRRVLTGAR